MTLLRDRPKGPDDLKNSHYACKTDNTENQSGVYIKLEWLNTSVVWVRL